MDESLQRRKVGMWSAIVLVAIVATAFAVGGSSQSSTSGSNGESGSVSVATGGAANAGGQAPRAHRAVVDSAPSVATVNAPAVSAPTSGGAAGAVSNAAGGSGGGSAGRTSAGSDASVVKGSGLSATRIVKTGDLSLAVRKGGVPDAVAHIAGLATRFGGYVASSRTDSDNHSPTGEIVLRVPVGQFEGAVTAAEQFGKQTSLETSSDDVTGKFVDLQARLGALERTRQTYLTILGRARTIGQTLSVQQRVDEVQQRIEELQGQIKVLRNQSNDGTLTVDVSEVGDTTSTHPPAHHQRHGFSLAWHNSIDRFNRGLQAIVGALGPMLLAALLIAIAYVVIRLGMRVGPRRTT